MSEQQGHSGQNQRSGRAKAWARRIARSRHGLWLMGLASFLESLVVPIPLELVLVPYMLANRQRLWLIALVVTAACLLGATVGYGVGFFLFDQAGDWLLETMDWQGQYDRFQDWFQQYGFWAIVAIGVTPMPFQVAMLVAGVSGYPVPLFLLAAALARGIRYFGLALLVQLFGEQALALWRNHSKWVGIAIAVVLVAGYFLLR